MLVMSVAVNHWFQRKRTLAQSIMLLGYSMAGVVGVPLLVSWESSFGWGHSAIYAGFLIWAIGFPAILLLRNAPENYGLQPDGDTVGNISDEVKVKPKKAGYDFKLGEAIRTRAFWFLAVGWAIGSMGMVTLMTHFFLHMEEDVGVTAEKAALVWTVASLSNIPFRLLGGYLGDRLPKNLLLGFATLSMAGAVLVLSLTSSMHWAFVFSALWGIGWGIRTPVMNAIQGEYFGRKSMGIIFGWLQSLSLPFAISAPIVVGHLADVQGNYRISFIGIAIIMTVGAAVISLATKPKPHPQVDTGIGTVG
jgi:sugar phosphate permease